MFLQGKSRVYKMSSNKKDIRNIHILVIAILIVLLGTCVLFILKSNAEQTYYSCAQAHAAGVSNIPKTSSAYRLSLDRDKDGIACEL